MPYDVSDLHKGVKVQLDGEPYLITEYDFMKPGKGQAIYRCKMRNMITGSTTEKAYRPGDKIDQPDLSEKTIHFSYDEGDGFYVFIDPNTNDEIRIDEATLGRNVYFLEDDMECSVLLFNNRPIEVTLPVFVEKCGRYGHVLWATARQMRTLLSLSYLRMIASTSAADFSLSVSITSSGVPEIRFISFSLTGNAPQLKIKKEKGIRQTSAGFPRHCGLITAQPSARMVFTIA